MKEQRNDGDLPRTPESLQRNPRLLKDQPREGIREGLFLPLPPLAYMVHLSLRQQMKPERMKPVFLGMWLGVLGPGNQQETGGGLQMPWGRGFWGPARLLPHYRAADHLESRLDGFGGRQRQPTFLPAKV